jgi:hypothetical protein
MDPDAVPGDLRVPALEPLTLELLLHGFDLTLLVERGDEGKGESSATGAGQLGVKPALLLADGGDSIQAPVGHSEGRQQALVDVDQLLEERKSCRELIIPTVF